MSIINDAIYISHTNNFTSNSNFGLKISGKGLYDYYRLDNNYNLNGIGFQLISNLDDNRELAFVDTSNSNNPSLNFNFNPSGITIKSQNTININSNIFITSNNRIGIGTIDPKSILHIHSPYDTSFLITNDSPNIFSISKHNHHINISNSNGFIGIGTTDPQNFLDIRGNVILPYSKLGIGTTNPRSNLDVIGNCLISSNLSVNNIIISGKILNYDESPFIYNLWSNDSNSTNISFNSGNVGIGITNPTNLLDVYGRIACTDLNIGGAILTKELIEGTGTSVDIITSGTLKVLYGGTGLNSINSNEILIGNGSNPLLQTSNLMWSNNSLIVDGNIFINSNLSIQSNLFINGKIGIGTTNPETSIHIQSGIYEDAIIRIGDIYLNKSNQNFIISNSLPNGKIIIGNMTFNSNGFIGIGTTNPLSNLDIIGDVNITGGINMNNSNISNANIIDTKTLNISNIIIDNSGTFLKKDGTPFYASKWTNNESNIYFNSGFVGIGTTNPKTLLDIIGNVNISGNLNINNSNISNATFINAKTLNISNIIMDNSGIILKSDGTPFYASRWTSNDSNGIFYNSGFVGIGTTNPTDLLDVNGNISVKGNLNMNNSNISNALFINTKTLSLNKIVLDNTGVLTRADGTIIGSSPFIVSSINSNNIYYNNGFIGIGTINPLSSLDVVGNINISGNYKYLNSNIISYSSNVDLYPFSTSILNDNSNFINLIGNIGIGNTANNSNLIIYGNTYLRGSHYIQPNADGNAMIFNFNSNITQNVNNNFDINFKFGAISDDSINSFLTVYNRYQTVSSFNSAVKLEASSGTSLLLDSGTLDGIGNISFTANNTQVMNLNSNIVNINNYLDITGNSGNTNNVGGAYFTTTTQGTFTSGYDNTPVLFSLRTADNIICGKNSYALSDRRIKKDIIDINDNDALSKIMKIEPKTYNYIDTIERTSSNVYGFIAQQIREVIPEAVEIISKFIPNIYKLVFINRNKFILNKEDRDKLKEGDIIKIYTLDSIEEVNIIKINHIKNVFNNNSNIFDNNSNVFDNNSNIFDNNSYVFDNNSNIINNNSNVFDNNSNVFNNNSNFIDNNSNIIDNNSYVFDNNSNIINNNSNIFDNNSNIFDNNLDTYEIIINKEFYTNQIFIYGSYVNDFHILDKSYLYTLNICATQQIYRDICLLSSNLDYKMSVIR
jgi:hypothetical protein